jgi:hypothetical protein
LSYHVFDRADGETRLVTFDNERTLLPRFIAPDSTEVVQVLVRLSAPGTYEIEFDLVHETKTWFKERGGRTATALLTVI